MKTKKEKSGYFGMNIDPELKERITALAAKKNTYMSEIVKEAILDYLQKEEN